MPTPCQEKIKSLSELRYKLFDEQFDLPRTVEYDERRAQLNSEIDKLGNKILKNLKESADNIEFECIMEELSKLGHAPNLIYDDNGHWVVTSDGFQSINVDDDEPEDTDLYFSIKRENWKSTPREALTDYLNSLKYYSI